MTSADRPRSSSSPRSRRCSSPPSSRFSSSLAGYSLTLADGAAEAGALALASGGSATDAARQGLPGWARDDVDVAVGGSTVTVRLRPPSPFGLLGDSLAVTSSASAREG